MLELHKRQEIHILQELKCSPTEWMVTKFRANLPPNLGVPPPPKQAKQKLSQILIHVIKHSPACFIYNLYYYYYLFYFFQLENTPDVHPVRKERPINTFERQVHIVNIQKVYLFILLFFLKESSHQPTHIVRPEAVRYRIRKCVRWIILYLLKAFMLKSFIL